MSRYSEKVCKGTKFFCKLHASELKSASFYKSLTNRGLFGTLFEAEFIDINISACFFGSIAEDTKLGAHEETAPVETEVIVLGDRKSVV